MWSGEDKMPTYEISYEFPLGSGKRVSRDIQAANEVEARKDARVVNPTLTVTKVERNPIAQYLKSGDGQQFVNLLRQFENRMYVKVRNEDKFFSRYRALTGERLTRDTHGVLISEQDDKWGDEMMITFELGDFEPNFPADAKPRVYDGGRGILNDNDYIWYLIEQHGFRFGR
jgi:hypothetical protein